VFSNKHIPEEYLTASITQRRALLRGLVDTDGSLDSTGRVHYVGHNERLVRDVAHLARTLGHRVSIQRAVDDRPPHLVNGVLVKTAGVRWVAEWTPLDGEPPGVLAQKARTRVGQQRRVGIFSVDVAPPADGVCVQVDHPDGLFLVGQHLIPTHNSELLSHWVPVWYLDWFPHLTTILAMYAAELAGEFGAKVRDTIRESGDDLDVRVRRDSSARNRWNTTALGGFYGAGVGGILTGRGGPLILVDDPIKNSEEATSEAQREKLWEWWGSTLRTRLESGPDGGDGTICLLMTRWHEDDIAARLDREQPGVWRTINLPALSEGDGDPLGRPEGEPLWPARYSAESLERTRAELGPYVFNGMYQQRPTAPAGTIFQRDWWRRYSEFPRYEIEQWLASIDCTFTDADDSDFVVISVWGRHRANKYLLDVWRQRADFLKTCRAVEEGARRWPEVTEWVVENKANGPAVLAQLRDRVSGIVPFTPRDSKEARAQACAPTVAAGQVWLPNRNEFQAWLPEETPATVNDWIDEFAAFPKGVHDDQVDSGCQALLHMGVHGRLLTSTTWKDDRLRSRR
jgi:predicted phage terminase large subunit-like protein